MTRRSFGYRKSPARIAAGCRDGRGRRWRTSNGRSLPQPEKKIIKRGPLGSEAHPMTLSPLKQIESMPGLAGLSPQHKARLAKFRTPALLKYRWYPGIAFTIGFFSWMIIFGKGTDVLEDYPQWDLLRFLYSLGWIGYLAVGFLGYGIAIAFDDDSIRYARLAPRNGSPP